MKKIISKVIKAGMVLSVGTFFFSCSMGLESMDQNWNAASINSVRAVMNRADSEKMLYMGGSVLYSSNNPGANQLSQGAIVATRIGKVERIDLGGGQYAYKNSKTEYELGFINVDTVNKEQIAFTYYKFPSKESNKYVAAGSFVLSEGQSADLNGDGRADVKYTKPAPGRKGYRNNMWLTFICDVETSDTAAMFSVIPMQYERSAYPNGLLGINPEGQYIINKYNVGTNCRSVVSDISYGDYVLDTEANTLSRYVGESRNSRSAARSIGDEDLQQVEKISTDSRPEDFEFMAMEFTEDFDIEQLLSVMPSSIVKESFAGRSITENVAYLNRLIRESSFLSRLVEGKSGEAAEEIRNQLASAPITSEIERVIFCRHALTLMYPEYCPEVNLFSQSLSNILPWLYIDFGDILQNEEADESSGRSAASNQAIKKSKQTAYDKAMKEYMAEAEKTHAEERKTKVADYVDYEVKRDAIEKYFSTLKSYNFAPLFANLLDKEWLDDIISGINANVSVGIAGGISFANANPSIDFKIGLLVKFELENRIAVSIASTSFFANSAPEKKSISELQEQFNKKFPDGKFSEDDIKDYIDTMNKVDLKDELGLDSWAFGAAEHLQNVSEVTGIRPTKDAKSIHKAVNPIAQLPLVLTFDAQFDILFKVAAVAEFDNFTVGGIYMTVLDCKAGIDWGFRKKIGKLPILSSFWYDSYAACNRYSENAGFAGITSKNKKDLKIGCGVKFTISPVIEFRGGVGLGYSLLGASADITVGAKIDFFAPLSSYVGYAMRFDGMPVVILDMDMDAGFSYSGDVQFCLDPPILSTKRWNYDIPGLKDQCVWQIFKLRLENFEVVEKEGPKRKA